MFFSLAMYFTQPVYGKGTGPVLIDLIYCYSERDHINDCTVYSPYRPICTHNMDLSIVCTCKCIKYVTESTFTSFPLSVR